MSRDLEGSLPSVQFLLFIIFRSLSCRRDNVGRGICMPEILQELLEIKKDDGFVWTFKSAAFPEKDFETWHSKGNQIFFSKDYQGDRPIDNSPFGNMILDILGQFSIVADLTKDTKLVSLTAQDLGALKSAFEVNDGRLLFNSSHREYSFFYYYNYGLRFQPETEKFILHYRGDYVGHGDVATEEAVISAHDAIQMARDSAYAEGFAFKYLKRNKVTPNDYFYPYDEQPSRTRDEFKLKLQDKYIALSEKLMTGIEAFMDKDGKNIPLDYLPRVFAHIRDANESRRIQTSIHGIDTLIAEFRNVADVIQNFHAVHTQVSSLTSALKSRG